MTLRIYNGEYLGTGNIYITLNAGDNVYVGRDGFVSSDNGTAFLGNHSNHHVQIDGVVAADVYGVNLGSPYDDTVGETIVVGSTGAIHSAYTAAVIYGTASYISNHGVMTGANGIYIEGSGEGTSSRIINTGLIDAFDSAIDASGDQELFIINKGVILSGKPIFSYSASYGDVTFTNKGVLEGAISFGGEFGVGNDIYKGALGEVSGVVSGGKGNDRFIGGAGEEYFQGDGGRDILKGGGGGDHFIFTLAADSTAAAAGRDLITDFSRKQEDLLDLSDMDARAATMADDAFTYIGATKFTGAAGQLNIAFKNGNTFVQGDVDGNGVVDFAIELTGKINLTASDFVL